MTDDQDALALAERVLAILEEGSFSATYKFALFTAILDLCIEHTDRHGTPRETLTTRQLAERVVGLYWNHADPYGSHGTLRQGGVKPDSQAEILRRIETDRARWADGLSETVHRARKAHPLEFAELLDFVEWKLIEWPIPRLQVLGHQEDRFLYDYNWTQNIRRSGVSAYQRGTGSDFDNRLLLRPGVAQQLVRLNGVLRPLFRREWAVMVAGMNQLPEAELEDFLFGSARTSLGDVRTPLRDLHNDHCFYCDRSIGGRADVDHFIPWSRYADDGLDNLVLAHPKCNNSKRDFLASAEHVEHWMERSYAHDVDLTALARQCGWPRDRERSTAVACAVYLRLPASARLWRGPDDFDSVDHPRIRCALAAHAHETRTEER